MRRAFVKDDVVAYSTTSREGRSLRLQTIAWPSATSPVATPHGTPGRAASRVMIAGARSWHAAAAAAAPSFRNSRRCIRVMRPNRWDIPRGTRGRTPFSFALGKKGYGPFSAMSSNEASPQTDE